MATEPPDEMARRRALLTDSERERIADEDPDDENRRYQDISRVRRKIEDELPTDVEILREHHADLFGELQAVVCPDDVAMHRPGRDEPVEVLRGEESVDVDDLRGRLQDALEERDALEAECNRLDDELHDVAEQLAQARGGLDDATRRSVHAAATALEGDDPDVTLARNELDAALEGIGDG